LKMAKVTRNTKEIRKKNDDHRQLGQSIPIHAAIGGRSCIAARPFRIPATFVCRSVHFFSPLTMN
jgi:hypothetical protein